MSFKPNTEQKECITKIHSFIINNKAFSKFLINGSAGTGKTTILISSIVDFLNYQIIANYEEVKNAVKNKQFDKLLGINKFIISAPTNKAKDVLISKFNSYMNDLNTIISSKKKIEISCNETIDEKTESNIIVKNEINNNDIASVTDMYLLNEITKYFISFLTVSQLLSISRVINEMGEEEFTKGNERKITEKYNKPQYNNTNIIIDECSMLDSNTIKLLYIIRCPIIYIGDYCQLPPVNESLSPIFSLQNDDNIIIVKLSKVERCKNNITKVANILRDKIYNVIPDFNILKYKTIDITHYKKAEISWLDTYIIDIQNKLKNIKNFNNSRYIEDVNTNNNNKPNNKNINDTMALAWTNKCCNGLNRKIREKLHNILKIIDVDNNKEPNSNKNNNEEIDLEIDKNFIMIGDKLLIKKPYYKYGYRLYSSNIAYVSKSRKTVYKPLTFRAWCNLLLPEKSKTPTQYININNILTSGNPNNETSKPENNTKKNKMVKNINDYFANLTEQHSQTIKPDLNREINPNTQPNTNPEDIEIPFVSVSETDKIRYRDMFYKYHTYKEVITLGEYCFKDEIADRFNTTIPDTDEKFNLHEIKNNPIIEKRSILYMNWHRAMSKFLYGISNEYVYCRKCQFFIKKFETHIDNSCYIEDMINATENLKLDMYMTDLVSFTTSGGQNIYMDVPILDMNSNDNQNLLDILKNIVKNSYEVKIALTRQDEFELKNINKIMNEDDHESHNNKYITMSQMLGHYLSHVISSTYLEVDYGFVLTVHKSQGSTYNDVYIEYSNLLENKKNEEKYKLLYTAITRCSNKLHLFY